MGISRDKVLSMGWRAMRRVRYHIKLSAILFLIALTVLSINNPVLHTGNVRTADNVPDISCRASETLIAESGVSWGGFQEISPYLDLEDVMLFTNISTALAHSGGVPRKTFATLTGPLSNIEFEEDLSWLNVTGDGLLNYGLADVSDISVDLVNLLGQKSLLVEQYTPYGDLGVIIELPSWAIEGIRGERVLPSVTIALLDGTVKADMALVFHRDGGDRGYTLVTLELPGGDKAYYNLYSPGIIFLDSPIHGVSKITFSGISGANTEVYSVQAVRLIQGRGEKPGILVEGIGEQPWPVLVSLDDLRTPEDILLQPGGAGYPLLPGDSLKLTVRPQDGYLVVSLKDPLLSAYYEDPGNGEIVESIVSSRPLPKSMATVILHLADGRKLYYPLHGVSPLQGIFVVPLPDGVAGDIAVEIANTGLTSIAVDFAGLVSSDSVRVPGTDAVVPLDLGVNAEMPLTLEDGKNLSFTVDMPENDLIALIVNASSRSIDGYEIVSLPSVSLANSDDEAYNITVLPTSTVSIPSDADSMILVISIDGQSSDPTRVLVDLIRLYYKPIVVELSNSLWRCVHCNIIPNMPVGVGLDGEDRCSGQPGATDDPGLPPGCEGFCNDDYGLTECTHKGIDANYTVLITVSTYGALVELDSSGPRVTYDTTVYLAVSYIVISNGTIVNASENDGMEPVSRFDPVLELALGVDVDDATVVLSNMYSISTFADENITAKPFVPNEKSTAAIDTASNMLDIISIVTGIASAALYSTPWSAVLGVISTSAGVMSSFVSNLEVPDEPSPIGEHDFLVRRIFAYNDNGVVYDGVHNSTLSIMLKAMNSKPVDVESDMVLNITFYLPPGPSFGYECFASPALGGYDCDCRFSITSQKVFVLSLVVETPS